MLNRDRGEASRLLPSHTTGVTAIADMVHEWETPSRDWGDKTAFRLFNCGTFVLTGKMEKPALTKQLHQVIDGVCERLH